MSSKRILGIAGAAMIGTLGGTGAAHAVITPGEEGTMGAPVFAKETFQKSRKIVPTDGSGGAYYEAAAHLTASGELDVVVPFGIVVPQAEDAVVTVDLRDVVLTGLAPTLLFKDAAGTDIAFSATTDVQVVSGGQAGDRRVQFNIDLDSTSGDFAITHEMTVRLARLGVKPDMAGAEDGMGTIIIKTERPGVSPVASATVTLNRVVKVQPALELTVRPREQTADSQEGFTKFRPGSGVGLDRLAASVADIRLGLATTSETFFNAQRGNVASGTIRGVTDLISNDPDDGTAITFSGVTTFVEEDSDGNRKVYLGDEDCSPEGSSIQAADGGLKATLDDVRGGARGSTATDGTTPAYLCLKVDGATPIPETEAYKLNIDYVSVLGTDALHPPQNVVGMNLGSITREGSTVHIPYLTSNRKYNQRVVVVNRSGRSVPYSMTFTTAEGTTASQESRSGTLPAGRTVWLVHEDLVRFNVEGSENGGHGSAELTVASGLIDVATVLTNREDGSTDTVVLDPQ